MLSASVFGDLPVPDEREIVVIALATKSHQVLDRYPAWRLATSDERWSESRRSQSQALQATLDSIHHARY